MLWLRARVLFGGSCSAAALSVPSAPTLSSRAHCAQHARVAAALLRACAAARGAVAWGRPYMSQWTCRVWLKSGLVAQAGSW